MSKKKARPTRLKHRSKAVKFKWENGDLKILCPFCSEEHAIDIQNVSPCGTVLQMNAVQEIWKNTTCVLCGESDQERMVKVGDKFRHIYDCSPGKRLLIIPPKPSLSAKYFSLLPERVQWFLVKRLGRVPVHFKNDSGETGYFWEKRSFAH